jgi:hypothetical protein
VRVRVRVRVCVCTRVLAAAGHYDEHISNYIGCFKYHIYASVSSDACVTVLALFIEYINVTRFCF